MEVQRARSCAWMVGNRRTVTDPSRGSRRELVRPGEMVQGAGRQHLDFVTALGEPVRGLTHHRLRTSHDGIAVTRSDKGDASCLGIRRINL